MGSRPLFFKPLTGEIKTMKIFTNHRAALTTGIILALVLALGLDLALNPTESRYLFNVASFARWVHIGAGIFWIGLLYYFFVVLSSVLVVVAVVLGGLGGAGFF